jgi:glycosyltransferase involved in cell wall biosynthesis
MLAGRFDGVVMLTWSDWHTEPRSNRYHYATRLARHAPVLFVQPDLPSADWRIESTERPGVNILHVHRDFTLPRQAGLLSEAIRLQKMSHPLLWAYNLHLWRFALGFPAGMKVYHATEDYFAESMRAALRADALRAFPSLLRGMDLVVACSEGVLASYRQRGGYQGRALVLENGCDYAFYAPSDQHVERVLRQRRRNVALYQGGINSRLDFPLLNALAEALPDWTFWFCGAIDPAQAESWARLLAHPNVVYRGRVSPEEVRQFSYEATVGLIPLVQGEHITERSLPLKAFEYLACGLPVVSVPIRSLERWPAAFHFAATAEEFVRKVPASAADARDAAAFRQRLAWAREKDYDRSFQTLLGELENAAAARARLVAEPESPPPRSCSIVSKELSMAGGAPAPHPKRAARLKVLVLYDDNATHVNTVREHLEAFRDFSRHDVYYAVATNDAPCPFDVSLFDAVVVHYCVRVCLDWHISPVWKRRLRDFPGLKALFIQDEYDTTETARRFIEDVGISVVHTIMAPAEAAIVYPPERFPTVEFVQTLTGYVPAEFENMTAVKPLAERKLAFCYRGRELGFWYGNLAREKLEIGVRMEEICRQRGIPCDIAWRDEDRIYGPAWHEFLQSGRATLGTPSGSNVFDDHGSLRRTVERALKADPRLTYEDVHRRYVAKHDKRTFFDVLSPKIFEAIACRTALVLFPGGYNGALQPDVHYIRLERDFSNIDDVLAKVADDECLRAMTTRAFDDVIRSGNYSYRRLIAGFDELLSAKLPRGNQVSLFTGVVGFTGPDSPRPAPSMETESLYLPQSAVLGPIDRPQPDDPAAIPACNGNGRRPLLRRIAGRLPPPFKRRLRQVLGF